MEAVTVLDLVVLAADDLGLVFVGLGLLLSLVGIGWWMLRPQEAASSHGDGWEADDRDIEASEEGSDDDDETGGFVFSDKEVSRKSDDDSDLGFGDNRW